MHIFAEHHKESWRLLAILINGDNVDDCSRYLVALSSDNTTITAGAYKNDDNLTSSGHT